ncbi:MAG: glycoside hydrolase family 31 protein [Myxococcales bacterium]|nr:MAG: glycoside hydrolase family 31 protein [Myxococcales bacterium]
MKRITRAILALLLAGAMAACGHGETTLANGDVRSDGDGSAADGDEDSTDGDGVEDADAEGEENVEDAPCEEPTLPESVSVEFSPFAIRIFKDGVPLVSIADGEGSPFYLARGATRTTIAGFSYVCQDGDKTIYPVELSDGREATLTIRPEAEGAVQIAFRAKSLQERETTGLRLQVADDEAFYGLMERVVQGNQDLSWKPNMTEALDLRGQEAPLFIQPTISLYSPFFVSSAGYGVWVESDWVGAYRFGTSDPTRVEIEYEGPGLVFRIIPGETPLDATAKYARSSSLSLMPPRWAFGPWRWRDEVWDLPAFYDGTPYGGPYNSMIVEDILMMEALGIPCSLYWVDRPWGPGDFGYDDLEFDEQRLPQPVEMIDWLAGKDIRFMLWVAPWAAGEMAGEAVELSYTVDNPIPSSPFEAKLLDLTNEAAVTWWQDHIIPRIQDGVAGFKLDRGEEKAPDGEFFTGVYDNGMSYREVKNAFPRYYAAAVHGAFERAGVEEFAVMPRAGWVGSQAHAIFWGGDTATSEWGLRSAIIAVQRAALMNFPVWGSDTCGYGRPNPPVCARWLQFSAFTPLMEVGPTGNASLWSRRPDDGSGNVNENGYSYEPVYDAQLLAIWRMYARLHRDLMDYTETQARLAHEQGVPIVRPMIAVHPERPDYKDLFEQYYYGPDILVAPVWRTGQTSQDVRIPDGEWIDAWTGLEMTSNSVIPIETPIHKTPIFIRKGSGVDLGDLNARWAESQAAVAEPPDLAELAEAMGR